MAPAQAEARFFFCFCFLSLRLFLPEVDSLVSPTDSEPCSEEEPTEASLDMDSFELTLCGRFLIGELEAKASNPKKDQRLGVLEGLGVGSPKLDGTSGMSTKAGIELRRLGDNFVWSGSGSLRVCSSTAPAVLGRDSSRSLVGLRDRGEGLPLPAGSPGELNDMSEDMLPVTEWPGFAVIVLEVSLDTNDRGLGINSRVSEKPTLVLDAGLGSTFSGATGATDCATSSIEGSTAAGKLWNSALGSGGVGGSCRGGKVTNSDLWKSVGLVGALLPLAKESSTGGGRIGISFEDTALEKPRRWPLRGGWKVGDAKPLSDFVGLVLMTAIELPSRSRPPTNSLPPRRWPKPAGFWAEAPPALGVLGEIGGLRSIGDRGSDGKEAPGLKLNAGRAIRPLGASKSSESRSNLGLGDSMADWGRLPVAREKDGGADEGDGRAGKLKGGFGGGARGWRGDGGASKESNVGDR